MRVTTSTPPHGINRYYNSYPYSKDKEEKACSYEKCVPLSKMGSEFFHTILNKNDIDEETFFVRMNTYQKDYDWAKKMAKVTKLVSLLISKGSSFETILSTTQKAVNSINSDSEYYGVQGGAGHRFILEKNQRGSEYFDRYLEQIYKNGRIYPRSNEEYKDANTCKISFLENDRLIIDQNSISYKNLDLVKQEFEKLRAIDNPTQEDVHRCCATINWLIIQEMPYKKGNDSIASILTKAIYNAYNMDTAPLKEGVGADFEAFDTDLDEYIEKYPTFFETNSYKAYNTDFEAFSY